MPQTYVRSIFARRQLPLASPIAMSTQRLELLLQLHREKPTDAFTLFALAKEYEKLNQPSESLRHYLTLRQHDPQYVGLYYHLAKLYEQLDERDAALEAYAQGLDVAQAAGDRHAWNELNNAKLNLEME